MSDDVIAERRYTKDHEWAKLEEGGVHVGITAFAVEQLGDITLVNIDVKPGDAIARGHAFGTIESVKTLSDLFAPITGTVAAVNKDLEANPELVNDDCYGRAWMIAITPSDVAELGAHLDERAYNDFVKASGH